MPTIFRPGGPQRYAHQVAGLRKLIETRGTAALLFDPGLGKTATTLDYASILALKSPSRHVRVLVTCPLAAVDTWVAQAETFVSPDVDFTARALGGSIIQRGATLAALNGHPEGKMGPLIIERERISDPGKPHLTIAVINLDTFGQRRQITPSMTTADYMVEAVARFAPDLLIVDESHRIKSASSNTSRLMARVAASAPRRVILTGTVMPHSPLDVYGQWRFLDPYAFGSTTAAGERRQATLGSFRSRFAIMGGYLGREIKGFRNLDDMHRIMAERAIVARKEDALDLPPTMNAVVPVELSAAERRAYEEMKHDLAVRFADADATVPNRLAQLMRLRQITSGHLPDDAGNIREIGDSKARTISSIVHDNLAGERRIVVFSQFTHEINQLRTVLARPGTDVQAITGATSAADRLAIRRRFGSDDPARIVLIAQVRTMSLAVNELVTASHAVYGSLSQLRDDYVQSRDRLNRIGQTKPVTYWLALAPNTVDEVILRAHEQREDLEASMLRHIQDVR